MNDHAWERDLIKTISTQAITEQRKERRWKYVFRFLLLGYLVVVATLTFNKVDYAQAQWDTPHIAVVDIKGTISEDEVSAQAVIPHLKRALENEAVEAVYLTINSPGGSPVQSGIIFDEIRALKALHPDTPILAVIGDIAASGGYYIAAAADEIIADRSSIVGSIGVISGGFGFTGTMKLLGIERRLITSGENKALLDPFSAQNPSEVAHFKKLVKSIHKQFITAVKTGRGDKLKSQDVFNGLVWSGEQGVELGLVDSMGSVQSLTRERFDNIELLRYEAPLSLVDQLGSQIGISMATPFKAMLQWSWQ